MSSEHDWRSLWGPKWRYRRGLLREEWHTDRLSLRAAFVCIGMLSLIAWAVILTLVRVLVGG